MFLYKFCQLLLVLGQAQFIWLGYVGLLLLLVYLRLSVFIHGHAYVLDVIVYIICMWLYTHFDCYKF